MPRTKRNPSRCQSTPTQVHANSKGTQVHASTEGTSRNATQISPQSEPVAHTDSSTHNEAPPLLQTQSNAQRVLDTNWVIMRSWKTKVHYPLLQRESVTLCGLSM